MAFELAILFLGASAVNKVMFSSANLGIIIRELYLDAAKLIPGQNEVAYLFILCSMSVSYE